MNKIVQAWTSLSLIQRILIGLVIGTLLGIFGPADLSVITLLGQLFVGALKAIAPMLVFFLVINALARTKAPKSMRTVIALYIVSTLAAAFTAVIVSYFFPITLTLSGVEAADQSSPSDIGEVLTTLLTNIVANPVDALANANYLGILAWAIMLGMALRFTTDSTKDVFGSCARYPQVLINVPVASNDVKKAVMASDALWTAVRGEEEQLAGSGRVLVRPSGTEALMRVMVEAKTEEAAQAAADRLAALIPGLAEG